MASKTSSVVDRVAQLVLHYLAARLNVTGWSIVTDVYRRDVRKADSSELPEPFTVRGNLGGFPALVRYARSKGVSEQDLLSVLQQNALDGYIVDAFTSDWGRSTFSIRPVTTTRSTPSNCDF